MAAAQAKLCIAVGRTSCLLSRNRNAVSLVATQGNRFLTSHPQYKKPWNYKGKKFTYLQSFYDYTCSRLNENSRIILVDGVPGVGKSEFAKKLADHFKLHYIPAVTEQELFNNNGVDIRTLNDQMPMTKMKAHDLAMFYSEPDPNNMLTFGITQARFFYYKLYQYVMALRHVLSTGQGVVLENSVWADATYGMALKKMGYFTKKGYNHYMDTRKNCLFFFWKPNLVIHLDAPTPYVMKQIKKAYPQFANSPVLTNSYIDLLRKNLKESYMPYMRKYAETLTYDVTDMDDLDLLFMDLESLDLIDAVHRQPEKFQDWRKFKEEEWSLYRQFITDPLKVSHAVKWWGPWDCPELSMSGEESETYHTILSSIHQLAFNKSLYDEKGVFKYPSKLTEFEDSLMPAKDSIISKQLRFS